MGKERRGYKQKPRKKPKTKAQCRRTLLNRNEHPKNLTLVKLKHPNGRFWEDREKRKTTRGMTLPFELSLETKVAPLEKLPQQNEKKLINS